MLTRIFLLFIVLLFITSCNSTKNQPEQKDNSTENISNPYKPGFGEFMMNVQIHHAKLWFAGKNKNWKLADFELDEITETLQAIQTYQKEREETKTLPIIYPALDSVKNSVRLQNPKMFEKNFIILTNTCNACHKAVKFEFNVVKIPETPPFTNQDFSAK